LDLTNFAGGKEEKVKMQQNIDQWTITSGLFTLHSIAGEVAF
jgi:hypothetical protein